MAIGINLGDDNNYDTIGPLSHWLEDMDNFHSFESKEVLLNNIKNLNKKDFNWLLKEIDKINLAKKK